MGAAAALTIGVTACGASSSSPATPAPARTEKPLDRHRACIAEAIAFVHAYEALSPVGQQAPSDQVIANFFGSLGVTSSDPMSTVSLNTAYIYRQALGSYKPPAQAEAEARTQAADSCAKDGDPGLTAVARDYLAAVPGLTVADVYALNRIHGGGASSPGSAAAPRATATAVPPGPSPVPTTPDTSAGPGGDYAPIGQQAVYRDGYAYGQQHWANLMPADTGPGTPGGRKVVHALCDQAYARLDSQQPMTNDRTDWVHGCADGATAGFYGGPSH
ncbi:MAG: hypothetical protein ACTHMS_16180 [Jatrophihabitans sp.]|uniref:hypothetical protein n=1 Tax=Jatrophihabitans sp. TaxID=1932789 RepID=UPI003F800EAD